jgi:predicted nucleotidyltransferase
VTPLDSKIKRAFVEALEAVPGIQLAIVFGSIATGNQGTESDLDIAVDAGSPIDASTKMLLIEELAGKTGRPVDLVDISAAGEPLLGQILKHGTRILGSNTQFAELMLRHVINCEDFVPYRNRVLRERRRAWIGP